MMLRVLRLIGGPGLNTWDESLYACWGKAGVVALSDEGSSPPFDSDLPPPPCREDSSSARSCPLDSRLFITSLAGLPPAHDTTVSVHQAPHQPGGFCPAA